MTTITNLLEQVHDELLTERARCPGSSERAWRDAFAAGAGVVQALARVIEPLRRRGDTRVEGDAVLRAAALLWLATRRNATTIDACALAHTYLLLERAIDDAIGRAR